MRALLAIILPLSAFSLSGCMMPTQYFKPGVTQAQFEQDKQACIYDVQKSTANVQDFGDMAGEQIALFPQCMRAKGYTTK